MESAKVISHVIRLLPGDDLKRSIQQFVLEKKIEAGWIVTCVGSLTRFAIRFANEKQDAIGTGYFEIITLSGTLSVNGSHLHIGIANDTGQTMGGHLMEGCIVYTTAEIVFAACSDIIFQRENDGTTHWKELTILDK